MKLSVGTSAVCAVSGAGLVGAGAALLSLQSLTITGTLALGTTTAANLFLKLRNRRGLWSIIWAIALVLAAIVVIWVAYVFNLLTVGVTY